MGGPGGAPMVDALNSMGTQIFAYLKRALSPKPLPSAVFGERREGAFLLQ